ncbi:defensin J1-2-like [Solanum verrucosum]|uniref:defensin J1-2-like n=1 Tax=Solanum verrucosum TaxID=315347 RepID=UPI0020D18D87|nr:defensin J1-2-like [Solanum verrucosum]
MACLSKVVATILLMLMLVFSTAWMIVEAKTCESQSRRFKGLCFNTWKCRFVCSTERFSSGHCNGLRHRCICTKQC